MRSTHMSRLLCLPQAERGGAKRSGTERTVRNVIFSSRGPEAPIFIAPASTLTLDHSLFFFPQDEVLLTHGDRTYTCANLASLGEGNQCGDPRFIRPAWGESGDYHLQSDSPAINAGVTDNVPTLDLESHPRDAQPDLRAFEFSTSGGIPLPFPSLTTKRAMIEIFEFTAKVVSTVESASQD